MRARRLGDMADNTAGIVAIELLAAAQGIDLRKPVTTSPKLATRPGRRSGPRSRSGTRTARWRRTSQPAKALIATPLFRDLVPLRVTG